MNQRIKMDMNEFVIRSVVITITVLFLVYYYKISKWMG